MLNAGLSPSPFLLGTEKTESCVITPVYINAPVLTQQCEDG